MSTSDKNEKRISELQKRFDMRFSRHEGLWDADGSVKLWFYCSYYVAD